jgi:hypothetical protein
LLSVQAATDQGGAHIAADLEQTGHQAGLRSASQQSVPTGGELDPFE